MLEECVEIARSALRADCLADAWPALLEHVVEQGGETHMLFHYNQRLCEVRESYPEEGASVVHKYPREFLELGRLDPKFVAADPFARRAMQSARTQRVDTASPETVAETPAEVRFVNRFRDSGLRHGLVFPLKNDRERTLSALCVGVGFDPFKEESTARRVASRLSLLATYFNEGLLLRDRAAVLEKSPLSQRERECLTWVAAGRTTSEIGTILQLADSTVAEYLQSAMVKLGASNRAQACSRAVLLSLLPPL